MTTHHPMRDAEVHVFKRIDADVFISRLHPYDAYPIFWTAETEAEARVMAETFRDDAVAKHEAGFITRSEALAKAREARASRRGKGLVT